MQRRIFLTAERGKFLQLAALLRIQSCGDFYNHPREQISAAAALQVRNSLAPQLEDLAALRSGRDSQICLTFERRHRDLAAKRGNREGNRDFAIEVVFIALKHRVFLEVKHDVKIARRPTADAGFAISRRTQARAVADTRWDFQFDPAGIFDPTAAATTTNKTLETSAATAAEDLTENIERIVEPTTEPGGALRKSGVSISIIRGPLIDVDQDIVGLA